MVSKNIKYTIFERYPSVLKTTIPLIDILIGIGYYIWIFLYFFYELFMNLFKKGPMSAWKYIKKFFRKEDMYKGIAPEIDYDITENKKEDFRSLMEDTDITRVTIYKGKKAFIKLKEVIKENDLYEYIDSLPITYFILKEEVMEGTYEKDNIYLTRGYSKQVMIYIDFIYGIREFFVNIFKRNKNN